MTAGVDLRFAVTGGARTGLGHLMRCVALAEVALARGVRVGFSLHGEREAARALQAALPGVPVQSWSPDRPGCWAETLVLDTRESLVGTLAARTGRGRPTIVLDRLDSLELADLTILPVLHDPPMRHPRLLAGARYCVLPTAYRESKPPPYPGSRNLALVTLGGADPHQLCLPVCAVLAELLARDPSTAGLELHCVLGPAFRQREACSRALAGSGVVVHQSLSRREMCRLMARASCAVAGFGTTLIELAFMGVPTLYVLHHPEDLEAAARLESLGVGGLATSSGKLDGEDFGARARSRLLDPAWRLGCARRGRELLGDGDGASRVLDAILGVESLGQRRAS